MTMAERMVGGNGDRDDRPPRRAHRASKGSHAHGRRQRGRTASAPTLKVASPEGFSTVGKVDTSDPSSLPSRVADLLVSASRNDDEPDYTVARARQLVDDLLAEGAGPDAA